jgi:hypothetical protein
MMEKSFKIIGTLMNRLCFQIKILFKHILEIMMLFLIKITKENGYQTILF